MHADVQEAIFVTILVLGLVYAYNAIPKGLQDVRDAARSPGAEPANPPRKQLPPDAEEKIDVDTLRVLSEAHSFELRASVIKIVAARAVTNSNRKILLQHLACKNPQNRDEAINALWLLYGHESQEHQQRASMLSHFQDEETFEAIVTALTNVLPFHKTPSAKDMSSFSSSYPHSPVRPFGRPPQETKLMQLLIASLRGSNRGLLGSKDTANLELALDVGLVSRWLAEYPFPCALPQFSKYNYKKSDVCSLFGASRYAADDQHMHEIFRIVSSSSRGSNQLRAVGLKAFRITENISHTSLGARRLSLSSLDSSVPSGNVTRTRTWETDDDTRMVGGEDTAGEPMANWTPVEAWPNRDWDDNEPHQRSQERSQEEMSLRRRNRETFVIAERGQPSVTQSIPRRRNTDQRLQELADDRRLLREMLLNGSLPPGTTERLRRTVLGEGSDRSENLDGMPDLDRVPSNPLILHAPPPLSRTLQRQVGRRASTGGQPESSRAAERRMTGNDNATGRS